MTSSGELKVSIIVPVYNAVDLLRECLDALLEQTIPLAEREIIVVDDGSTDGSGVLASAYAERGIKLLKVPHGGAAAARNAGIRAAGGKILLFTDADCRPEPDWAAMLSSRLEKAADQAGPGVKIAGAKGVYITGQRQRVARYAQLEFEDRYLRLARQPYLEFVDTYSAAYFREVVMSAGGFDRRYPGAIVEDAELAWRLAAQGYRMVFAPEAKVAHRHVTTVSGYWRRKYRIGYWRVAVYRRHPERLTQDNHTSATAKVQMVLLALGLGTSGGALAARRLKVRGLARWLAGTAASAGFLFAASTAPFTLQSWQSDRETALLALPMQLARATAFCSGALAGVVSGAFKSIFDRSAAA